MIDVIIPAYNAKDTLGKTLCSIAMQKLSKLCDVTVVNDASGYSYQEIINPFKNYFNSIKEIILEKNSGPGIARQVGIDNTTNPYFTFIDSDDTFVTGFALNYLFDAMKNDYDIKVVYAVAECECFDVNQQFATAKQSIFAMRRGFIFLHAKMFRREFVNDIGAKFSKFYSNEDGAFCQQIITIAGSSRIKYIPKVLLSCWHNKDSITRGKDSLFRCDNANVFEYVSSVDTAIISFKFLSDYYKEQYSLDKFGEYLYRFYTYYCKYMNFYHDSTDTTSKFIFISYAKIFYDEIVEPILRYLKDNGIEFTWSSLENDGRPNHEYHFSIGYPMTKSMISKYSFNDFLYTIQHFIRNFDKEQSVMTSYNEKYS